MSLDRLLWHHLCVLLVLVPGISAADDLKISNQQLSVVVRKQDGAYVIQAKEVERPAIRSLVAAQINHHWIKSNGR
jgi:hypothetical protein